MQLNSLSRLIANCSGSKTINRRSSGKSRLVLFACVIAFGVISVLAVRAYNSGEPASRRTLDYNTTEPAKTEPAPGALLTKPAVAQNTGLSPALPGVVITLGPNGFEPRTVTHPVGPFAVIFLDRTRLDGISLSFEGDSRTPPRRMTVEKRRPERVDTYDLSPGHYVLREENHPGWLCEITITPK